MSYPYQQYAPPAGSAPPPSGQYGVPPSTGQYGAPPPGGQYGNNPYGQQAYGQSAAPYGQQPAQYGQQNQPYGQQSAAPYGQQAPYGGAPPQQTGYVPPQKFGGAPQQPPYGGQAPQMPPGADPQLWNWFMAVDADKSQQINPQELQQALVNGDWSPFSLETVQLMMTLFDADASGTINFNEFTRLWHYIEDWKRIFQQFDKDRSTRIDRNELKQALLAFGYNVSDRIVDLMIKKFAKKEITFDAFISCCVTVKSLSDAFQRYDTDRDGWVNMSHDQFLEVVISTRPT